MMYLWRLTKAETINRAFDGEGARIYGGRWNQKGTPVVYVASSISLSVLEVLVHVDSDLIPKLQLYKVEVPDDAAIAELSSDLPLNWRNNPPPEDLQDIGTQWINEARTLLLKVPPAVVPYEWNYLINPQHPGFKTQKIGQPERFEFDPRLRK